MPPRDPPPAATPKRKPKRRATPKPRPQAAPNFPNAVPSRPGATDDTRPGRRPAFKPPTAATKDTKGDADRGRAEKHKKTKAYRGAIKAGYKSKPVAERKKRVARAEANIKAGRGTREDKVIAHEHKSNVDRNRELAKGAAGKDTKGDADRARAEAFKTTRQYQKDLAAARRRGLRITGDIKVRGPKVLAPEDRKSAILGNILEGKARGVKNLAVAGYHDPLEVTAKTLKSAPAALAGIPAGIVDTVIHPSKTAKDYVADAKKRAKETDKQMQARIKKEGGLVELLDIATVSTGAGAVVGRGAGVAMKSGKLGKGAKAAMTEPRPKLRTGGGRARPQQLSPNAIKASLQRYQDDARATKTEKIVAAGKKNERGVAPIRAQSAATNAKAGRTVEVNPTSGMHRRNAVAFLTGRDTPRRAVAQRKSRAVHERAAEYAQIAKRVNTGLARLSKSEQRAFYSVASGTVPANAAKAVPFLQRRKAAILAAREADGVELKGLNKLTDELRVIDKMLSDPDSHFTQNLADVVRALHRQDVEVSKADPRFAQETKLLRRHSQQADVLGLERGVDLEAPAGDLPAMRYIGDETSEQFARRVRAAADEEGLERPLFFPSERHALATDPKFADFAVGGQKAMSPGQRYEGKNFRLGRQDTNPAVYLQGLARSTKAKHNWKLVADTMDDQAFPDLRNMTLGGLREKVRELGMDTNDIRFWNPGEFRRQLEARGIDVDKTVDADNFDSPDVEAALHAAANPNAAGAPESGWAAVSRDAFEEIMAGAQSSGMAGRVWDIGKSKAARYLLGSNPSWLAFQVAGNSFTGALAMKHRLPSQLIKQAVWYRQLSDAEKTQVNGIIGAHGYHDTRTPKLGAASTSYFVNGYRAFKEQPLWDKKPLGKGPTLRQLNPIEGMLSLDRVQTNQFRRAAFLDTVEGDALRTMGASMGKAHELQGHITRMFTLQGKDQVREILDNPELMAEHAQHVNEWLGDFTSYTSAERRVFSRVTMFSGFLRYSLRLAFYTMPVKHPVTAALLTNLGELHEDELEEMGLADFAGARGKVYNADGTQAVDLARMNPFLNQLTSINKPSQVMTVLPPAAVMPIEQAFGTNAFTGKKYLVDGDPSSRFAENPLTMEGRGRIALDDALSLFAPYREGEKYRQAGAPHGDDSLLWGMRPVKYSERTKDGKRINKSIEEQVRETRGQNDRVLRQLLPLLPSPVADLDIAANERDKKNPKPKKKARRKRAAKALGGKRTTGLGGG